ncbi:MAG: DNA polymerase III subunit beta, partial [Rhabdochlamydiaceae bacterium]
MQFAIARLDLVSLIGKIQSVVPSHPSLPILSNILMEVKEGKLTVTATDLIISIQASIDVEQFQEGSITLPARKFFQLTRELTAARIEISSLSNEIARIKAGSSDFKIQGLNKSEFPLFPEISSSTKIKLKPNILKEMLTRASFCVARDESRQVFTGLLLSYHNHQMITMGANGKRLAKITSFIEHPSQEHLTSIIPLKTVDELVKILD